MSQFGFGIAVAIIIIVHFSSSSGHFGDVRTSDECVTPGGRIGICKNINKCQPLRGLLIRGKSRPLPWVMTLLRKSHCGFEGKEPVVCCPIEVRPKGPKGPQVEENATVKKRPLERFFNTSCGTIQIYDKIIGGTAAAPHEFPWMALIGYKTRSGLEFRCGGSLISSRFVLTAAHCVTSLQDIHPTTVRLGEHNTSDYDDDEDSGRMPKDIPIEELIPHPQYSKPELRNDIALIRLAKRVEFVDYIRPICLPLNKDVTQRNLLEGNKAVVTGWGSTETGLRTNVLRKVTVPIIPLQECSKVYQKNVPITESHICAGGERGRDACSGDSGGPLQILELNPSGEPAYVQHGVVSFGPRFCGSKGMPGVYTKVGFYIDWITLYLNE